MKTEYNIYVIDRPANGHELRFINGLGCLESVHVTAFAKKEANIHTEKHTVAKRETLKKFSRTMTVKTEDYETWTLTTGPLDEDWVSWYVHEVLMAQLMWIGVNVRWSKVNGQWTMTNGAWVPCHVLPEETTVFQDKEKASMMSIRFRVQLDINGLVR